MLLYLLQNLIILAVCGLAWRIGNTPERVTGVWVAFNATVYAAAMAIVPASPTFSLLSDGVFSIGLLPIACLFVTWATGVACTIMAASFAVQAFYMLSDRQADQLYYALTNWACLTVVLTLLIATLTSASARRRSAAAAAAAAAAEPRPVAPSWLSTSEA